MTMLMAPSKAVLAGRTELSVLPGGSGDGAGPAQQAPAAAGSQASNGGDDAGGGAKASEGGDGAGASPQAAAEAASASAESAVP